LVTVLGYDIGGANTKAALIHTEKGRVLNVKVAAEYFPIWKEPARLTSFLLSLKARLIVGEIDALGLTITAELSDAYQTKREGVHHILSCIKCAFPSVPIFVLNTNAQLCSLQDAEMHPLDVAAANWAATGWLISQKLTDAVVVDVGSTSTSIIPIVDGHVAAQSKTDLDKLICGELVYTGSLRTNVAAIIQSVPIKDGIASVSSELFALSGDVHLALGHISAADYISETADGRGKTVPEALARLSRVVCADTDMLTKKEILAIAQYIYEVQVEQIAVGLKKVYAYTKSVAKTKVPIVVTGLGKDFLACKAAEQINADSIVDLGSLLPKQAVYATPAVGTAFMVATKLSGETPSWI
jgi:(4-(4-[2-(gamma-L-glutamylamino)ethyl]phenoxymethyl)furan-2-yl)methanamine synthase